MSRSMVIAVCMAMAIIAAWALTPRHNRVAAGEVRFAEIVPLAFADWKAIPNPLVQVDLAVKRDERDQASLLFDEVLSRSYRNSAGDIVMLSIAYGRQQRQELKIHRPELCYASQGFRVTDLKDVGADSWRGIAPIAARRMLASGPGRIEPVLYWIRIGEMVSTNALQARIEILKEGLAGRVPDGVLVRTSQIVEASAEADRSIAMQRTFVEALITSIPAKHVERLVGA